jgi:3'-phosphoadenosine 5'-phosphosulfate sulfotransferase (PAPS reductase)/FAD synthetase
MKCTEEQRELARYIQENGIRVSAKCCDYSKKKPLKAYIKSNYIDLNVTGERKAEGGQRALAHKSCFECSTKKNKIDKYMPLWWWSDSVKACFKKVEGIRYSDCYEVYGMRRTGCVGCPFNIRIGDDLRIMQIAEPRLYKACMNVFGESYRLMDQFHARARKCIPDDVQQSLFILEGDEK